MDPAAAAEIWELPHLHIGRRVWHFARLPNTSDFAAGLAADPDNAGAVVLADEQTAGRGQYGRRWLAPPGSSVMLSVLLFPPPQLRRPAILTVWAAVAVAETILQSTGRQAKIKWPNDVLLHGKKVCGILIEQARGVVVGIGLNANQNATDFEAAGLPLAGSLAAATGQIIPTADLARRLIAQLDREYDLLLSGETTTLEACWKWRLGLLGRNVIAREFSGATHRGRLLEITFDGLELELAGGTRLRLAPEQVHALSADESAVDGQPS